MNFPSNEEFDKLSFDEMKKVIIDMLHEVDEEDMPELYAEIKDAYDNWKK
ncbi:hypothetical protein R2R35_19765 [Anaerocolumna sp. AGMB13020]|nr:hypothetical protein [Anaerocolumna sp. AGMB13020]WOO36010.1 hypothetical protein R2R35_19765 [Anaerocolumna sp. AGMB13020]